MVCEIVCDDGHSRQFFVPNEISAEDVLSTSAACRSGETPAAFRQARVGQGRFEKDLSTYPGVSRRALRRREKAPELSFSGGPFCVFDGFTLTLGCGGAVAVGIPAFAAPAKPIPPRRPTGFRIIRSCWRTALSYTARAGTITCAMETSSDGSRVLYGFHARRRRSVAPRGDVSL